MTFSKSIFTGLLLACFSFAPTPNSENYRTLMKYLHAGTLDKAMTYVAPDFIQHFNSPDGKGITKAEKKEMMVWDYTLHSKDVVSQIEESGDKISLSLHEENDFSKLIGYPGWEGRVTYRFNKDHLIFYEYYQSSENEKDYGAWLKPALEWLKVNRATELSEVYKNGRLIENQETAIKWVRLLKEWKKAKSR